MRELGRAPPALRIAVLVLLGLGLALAELPEEPAGPPLGWRTDVDAALSDAAAAGRPVLLSFFSPGCSACSKLDRHSLRDPRVAAQLERFERIRVEGADGGALRSRYGVVGVPTLVFLDRRGRALEGGRTLGFVPAEQLLDLIAAIGASDLG